MQGKLTLLDKAKSDLRVAGFILNEADEDVDIDIAAYHCAQCIEKAVKFYLTLKGIKYPRDHFQSRLMNLLDDDEIKQAVSKISDRLDNWSGNIRYSTSIVTSRDTVTETLSQCKEILKLIDGEIPNEEEIEGS